MAIQKITGSAWIRALLILGLSLWSNSAWGQSFKQYALVDYTNQTSGALQFGQATTPGALIVVSCTYKPQYGHCTAAPTDTEGNTYILISTRETANGNAGQKVYYASSIAGGTLNMVTCHSEAVTSVACMGVELLGVNTLDQGGDSTQATGNDLSPISPAVTTTRANEILLGFGAMNPGSASTFSAYGPGWTGIVRGSQSAEYQVVSSVGSYTATNSVSSADDWVEGIFTFYQAPPLELTLNPQTVAGGFPSTGKVTLALPAPVGGALVALSNSNPAVAAVPANVTVPATLTSTTFNINTSVVSSATSADISAAYNSLSSLASLAVKPVNTSVKYSIWNSSAAPTVSDGGGASPIEVGVKFTADVNGFISGIRFYKSAANTGTHTGSLWTGTGQLLATATFTGETASGWQQVNFSSPIFVVANTIYVASYHTNAGHVSADAGYFTSIGVDNPPLHAPASGLSGGNGVFAPGAGGVFPQTTNLDTNYWTDVVFLSGAAPSSTSYVIYSNPTSLSFSGVVGNAISSKTVVVNDTTPLFPLPLPSIFSDQPWLTVTPNSGQTAPSANPFKITVGIVTTGLAAGTYHGNIIVTAGVEPNGDTVKNSPYSIPVTLTLSPVVVSVGISPTSASLLINQTKQFTATVSGTPNTAVTWSASGGTVSSSGLFTAPAIAGTYIVRATSQADPSKSATATVTVKTSTFVIYSNPTSLTFSGTVGSAISSKNVIVNDTTPLFPLPLPSIVADQPWLKVTPGSGQTAPSVNPFKITVSVVTTGLSAGTYRGKIIITAGVEPNGDTVNNSPFSIPVTLTIRTR